MDPVYLDHHATTRPCPQAIDAVNEALTQRWANPSSAHRLGQHAKAGLELARGQVARLLGVRARELTFTGSGTESIDLGIRGVLGAMRRHNPERNIVISSSIEHSAIRNLCKQLDDLGSARWVVVAVGRGGAIDADDLGALLDEHGDKVALVSVQWVNNETGVIQPIEEIGAMCRARGVLYHCDATQWVGKMPTALGDDDAPKIDLLSCSSHKFHGPKGAGVLWVRRGVGLLPTTPGSQELGRRGGTEALPAIMGMGAAAEAAMGWLREPAHRDRLRSLRDRLEAGLLEACPGAQINGDRERRIWSATNIGFPGLSSEALLLGLSERGVCVSAGSACASGSIEPSAALMAMGIEERVAFGSIRLSLSRDTSETEIDRAIDEIARVVAQVSRAMPG